MTTPDPSLLQSKEEAPMEHTPGPWQAYSGPMNMTGGLNPFFKGIVALLSHEGPQGSVAVILDRDEPAYAFEANARLIATAPELLDAVVEMHALLARQPSGHASADFCSCGYINLIARARGEA